MPKVKFSRTAIVLDRLRRPGDEADLSEEVAKDVVASGVGSVVAGSNVRTTTDDGRDAARKAVKLEG